MLTYIYVEMEIYTVVNKIWLNIIGYSNWIFYTVFPKVEEKVTERRLRICLNCNYKHKDYQICTLCGCPIGTLTRAKYYKKSIGLKRKGCKKKYW